MFKALAGHYQWDGKNMSECDEYDQFSGIFMGQIKESLHPKKLLIILNEETMKNGSALKYNSCNYDNRERGVVDLLLVQKHTLNSQRFLNGECFGRMHTIELNSRMNSHTLLAILESNVLDGYSHIFWWTPGLVPAQGNWLAKLITEMNDPSPFFLKSSVSLHDEFINKIVFPSGRNAIQRKIKVTGDILFSLSGVWQTLLKNILSEISSDYNNLDVSEALNFFIFSKRCHFKLVQNYVNAYSAYSDADEVYVRLFDNATSKVCFSPILYQMALNGSIDEITHMRYSRKSMIGEIPYQILNNLLEYGVTEEAESISNLEFLSEYEAAKATNCILPTARDALNSGICPINVDELPIDGNINGQLLIYVPFGSSQVNRIKFMVARWELSTFIPCKKQGRSDLLFLHSGSGDRGIQESLIPYIESHMSIKKCFRKFFYDHVPLLDDVYSRGPPAMFREIVLGSYSNKYDFVFQMEPDVLPIRPYWVEKLHEEMNDSNAFLVKGSGAMYMDIMETTRGCLQVIRLNQTLGYSPLPLGDDLLHINGNALYSLSAAAKETYRQFFIWAEKSQRKGCSRKWRLDCSTGQCDGSFDVGLMEFISSRQNFECLWTMYKYSDFIVNGGDTTYFPYCLSENTYFIHKPWVFKANNTRLQCRSSSHLQVQKESKLYATHGFPPKFLDYTQRLPSLVKMVKKIII